MAERHVTLEAFFATRSVRNVLDRAAIVSGVPVSLHTFAGGRESVRAWGCGSCAACAYVNGLQWGPQFCRRSRSKPASASISRARPVPFLCHMQFPCVSVAAIFGLPDAPVLTFGPYCPVEAPGSLERDALERLPDVAQADFDALPFRLDDVPLVSAAAVFAAAEWTAETLTAMYRAACEEEDVPASTDDVEPAEAHASTARKRPRAVREAYQAADLLAALVAGDSARFRQLVAVVLDDGDAAKRVEIAAERGRALAMAGAILEAAERAGYATDDAWAAMPALAERLANADAQHGMAGAVRDALRSLRRAAVQATGKPRDFAPLYRAVSEGLADGVTLESVAEAIGENPSALSKRLQRKLNMSFSEYKGRVRVDRAKELLRRTDLTIGEVARRVGIGDPSNFSRLFEQHEGLSPSKYRHKHRR